MLKTIKNIIVLFNLVMVMSSFVFIATYNTVVVNNIQFIAGTYNMWFFVVLMIAIVIMILEVYLQLDGIRKDVNSQTKLITNYVKFSQNNNCEEEADEIKIINDADRHGLTFKYDSKIWSNDKNINDETDNDVSCIHDWYGLNQHTNMCKTCGAKRKRTK